MDDQIVRLKKPASVKKTGKPERWRVIKDGQTYDFEWGADFRVSHHCDPENEVANLDAKGGYPLLRDEFYQQYKTKFKPITTNED